MVGDLQASFTRQSLLLLSDFFDGFRAFGQGRLVEQGQQRRKAVTIDQAEDLDIALRRRAPAGDIQGSLRLRKKPVLAWNILVGVR